MQEHHRADKSRCRSTCCLFNYWRLQPHAQTHSPPVRPYNYLSKLQPEACLEADNCTSLSLPLAVYLLGYPACKTDTIRSSAFAGAYLHFRIGPLCFIAVYCNSYLFSRNNCLLELTWRAEFKELHGKRASSVISCCSIGSA